MKYIFFATREVWPAFNSIYAYIKLKGKYPSKFVALYTDENVMRAVEKKLEVIYRTLGREFSLTKLRVSEDYETVMSTLQDIIAEGDIVDITGARKGMILGLLGIKNVKVVYLRLDDMRFANKPFMMRPLSIQSLSEVEL